MAREIVMPKLGLTMSEGTIVKWHVSEGDSVSVGDKILSIETDKLTNDVEADEAGFVRLLLYGDGDKVPVKELVAVIAGKDEDISKYKNIKEKLKLAKKEETVGGSKVEEKVLKDEIAPVKNKGLHLATPYAKQIAREKKIDLSLVEATGYDGVIVAKDVENLIKSQPKMTGAARNAARMHAVDLSGVQSAKRLKKEDILNILNSEARDVAMAVERVRASNMRKIIAKNMLNNWNTSPMVTFDIDVNMDKVIKMRKLLNEEYAHNDIKITYNHIILKALSLLLLKHKSLNAYFDGEYIEYHNYANIGIAVATENGLLVPNLKGVERLSLPEIAVLTEDLIERCRANKLRVDEIEGATFTITNLGMYGLKSFTPIINKPEAAILGVNAIRDEVKLYGSKALVAKVCTFSLTADHTLVDGRDAGEFLQDFKKYLENPYLML